MIKIRRVMSKFKKGDWARRVTPCSATLTEGKAYEVKRVTGGSILLRNDRGKNCMYLESFFELVKEPEQELTVQELCEWLEAQPTPDTDSICLLGNGQAFSQDAVGTITGTVSSDSIGELTKLVRAPKTFKGLKQLVEKHVDPERINYSDIVALGFEVTEHTDEIFKSVNGFDWVSAELKLTEDAYLQYDNEFGFAELLEMDGVNIKDRVFVPNLRGLVKVYKTVFPNKKLPGLSTYFGLRKPISSDPSYLAI